MNVLSAVLLLAVTIRTPPSTLDDEALASRFERECAGIAAGADCGYLRRELEIRLLADLRELAGLEQTIDRDVLRVAAGAEFPFLATFGLQQMQRAESAEDDEAVLLALDHPSPAVRFFASEVAKASNRPRLTAVLAWRGNAPWMRHDFESFEGDEWAAQVMPETPRTLLELGLPDYAAKYRFSMSDATLAVFTTADPPEKVVAAVAKGSKTLGADEVMAKSSMEVDMSAVTAITEKMEGVTDPQKVGRATQQMSEAMMAAMQPMANNRVVRDIEGRYFELPVPGEPQRKRWVGIGRDAAIGVTTIAVTLP